jgi:hypothetical protein
VKRNETVPVGTVAIVTPLLPIDGCDRRWAQLQGQ